jgi:hypothetical protein
MTITTPVLAGDGIHPVAVIAPWAVNYHTADLGVATTTELKATPGAGKAIYLTHVTMCIVESATYGYLIDNKITLKDGDGTVLFGPIQLQAQGSGIFKKDFTKPLKLTDSKSLTCAIARSAGGYNTAALVYVEGFTGQKPIT